MQFVDVAIVGAGPAGLATAIGLRRALGPSPTLAIFERAASLREVGGQVGLIRPAFSALDALDPSGALSDSVTEGGVQREVFRMLDPKGRVLNETQVAADAKQVVIAWFELQRVLLAFLRSSAGGQEGGAAVHLGCALETLEERAGDVLLTFADGRQCAAKMVLGADGNLSRVRAALFPEDAEPAYAGSCIWRMFLRGDYGGIAHRESNVWTGEGKVLAVQKMETGNDQRLYVSGQAAWPEDQLHALDRRRYIGVEDGGETGGGTKNSERLERFLETFVGFPPDVLEFAREHHDSASILEHPIYFRPPGRPWGRGRVALIGDAAHMIPPNMAMGTPLAFEDAVSLAHSVREHGVGPAALRAYEQDRQPRVNRIAHAAITQSGLYYKEKDDEANPFKLNDKELFAYVVGFSQEPVPCASGQ